MQGTIDRVGLKINVNSYSGITRDDVLGAVRKVYPTALGVGDPTELNRHVDAMWTGIKQQKPQSLYEERALLELEMLSGNQEISRKIMRVIEKKVYLIFGIQGWRSGAGPHYSMTRIAMDFFRQGVLATNVLRRLSRINTQEKLQRAASKRFQKSKGVQ